MGTTSEARSLAATTERGPGRRDAFATGLGVLAATVGSAVGLGNIWKFPSLTGQNGGAAFIIVYLLCTLLVGLPVMISEQMLGRRARKDAVNTMRELAPKHQPWWLIGAAGGLAAFLIMAFYSEVAGWVFAYVFKERVDRSLDRSGDDLRRVRRPDQQPVAVAVVAVDRAGGSA